MNGFLYERKKPTKITFADHKYYIKLTKKVVLHRFEL